LDYYAGPQLVSMEKIITVTDLKNAIQQLENRQESEWVLLKEEFNTTCDKLKPSNLVKSAFNELISAPDLKTNIAKASIGAITGFAAKKIFIRNSHNPLIKLAGFILKMAIASNIVKDADEVISMGGVLLKKIFNRHDKQQSV
jgi:hypothetical protein